MGGFFQVLEKIILRNVITVGYRRRGERRYEMKKNILILACLCILLALPNIALADCADLGGFNNFSVTGGQHGHSLLGEYAVHEI